VTLAPSREPKKPLSKLTPYQKRLFVFLGVATFFEGFDYIALAQILPTVRAEFGLSIEQGGRLLGIIGFGAMLAYVLIRMADVLGRRRVLGITIAGYTLFSFASALTQDAFQFGLAQVCARLFLLAEYAVSMVYIAEEFPADRRAFAVGAMQGLNSLGAIVCAGLVPMLLKTPWGFRSIYLVGTLPLLLMMVLRRQVKETHRFEELKQKGLKKLDLVRVFRTPYWRRIPLLASIWALTYLNTYLMVTYWKEFAVAERGFDDKQVSLAVMIAALGSLPLVFMSGKLLDTLGRKRGSVVIFGSASVACLLGTLTHKFGWLTLGLTGGIFAASAVLPVLSSYTLELFPTDIRADAYGWTSNVFGRVSHVLGPAALGYFAQRYGYGPSLAFTAIFPLLALAIIQLKLPETRGKELEETSALH
jgi:putative MFS transporter